MEKGFVIKALWEGKIILGYKSWSNVITMVLVIGIQDKSEIKKKNVMMEGEFLKMRRMFAS